MKGSHDIPINCPKSGGPLIYLYTVSDTLFYRCERDGTVILPSNGRIRPDDSDDSAVRS